MLTPTKLSSVHHHRAVVCCSVWCVRVCVGGLFTYCCDVCRGCCFVSYLPVQHNTVSSSHEYSGYPGIKFNHGTTTMGFIFKNGVVIAVDSRASMGSYIGTSNTHYTSNHINLCTRYFPLTVLSSRHAINVNHDSLFICCGFAYLPFFNTHVYVGSPVLCWCERFAASCA